MKHDWIDDILDAATNPVGTHQIVTLAQGHRIDVLKHYGTKRAAFGQQTRILNSNMGRALNVYVISRYPEGSICWVARDTLLRERIS